MKGINYLYSQNWYEKQLSPFGKKVLQGLIMHKNKADQQNRTKNQCRYYPKESQRVIFFGEDTLDKPLYTSSFHTASEPCLVETDINYKLTSNFETVLESAENNDFLHPTVAASKNLVLKLHQEDSNNKNKFNEDTSNKNKSIHINWDDMLDSELLDDINVNVKESKRNDVHEPLNIIISSEVANKAIGKSIASKSIANKRKNKQSIDTNCDTNPKKARSKITKAENKASPKKNVKNLIQEKEVKSDKPKNIYKKQCYTKTVKNWLNDVVSHNSIEDIPDSIEFINNPINNNYYKIDAGKSKTEMKNIEKYNVKSINKKVSSPETKQTIINDKVVKKVVQAQLTNKGGVMKYIIPKENEEINLDMMEKKQGKNFRKFVPPIKSQIPLKDVTYDIYTVYELNIKTYEDRLDIVTNNEVLAVLIYSNGFCQLNSHHTDGACIPDGLVICCDNVFYCFKGTGQKLKEVVTRVMENNKIVCYRARDILIYIASILQMDIHSIEMYDAEIGGSLLDPDGSPENFSDLQKLLSFTPQYTISTECTLQKSAWYMTLLKECWQKLHGLLTEETLWNVFVNIEMKLLPIIADMERRGVLINLEKLKLMEEVLQSRMKLVERQCYKEAGKVFQINSALQVRAILYDELKLDTKCNVKIRETLSKGAKSTNETMLRCLMSEHPLPKLILEYRHLHKAHATFLLGIAQHIKDGVVRPTWVQTAAATGRIASNNPNLQAIPKVPFNLVMFSDADDVKEHLKFRSVYISREGFSFLAADFKQIECRVFAHAAADKDLQHALSTSDDLFRVLAAKWLKKNESEVLVEERERTKRLVYASLYGAGARKLMEILDVGYEQALEVVASFNRTFPSLKSFGRSVCQQLSGFEARVRSMCGRARRLPRIHSGDAAARAHAERQAVNFVVQGSAADLCKTAMIAVTARLQASSPPVCAHLVLQIHDELVWEVCDHDVHRTAGIVKQVMEDCGRLCGMSMKLPVSTSVGKNWGDMLDYTCAIDTQ